MKDETLPDPEVPEEPMHYDYDTDVPSEAQLVPDFEAEETDDVDEIVEEEPQS